MLNSIEVSWFLWKLLINIWSGLQDISLEKKLLTVMLTHFPNSEKPLKTPLYIILCIHANPAGIYLLKVKQYQRHKKVSLLLTFNMGHTLF